MYDRSVDWYQRVTRSHGVVESAQIIDTDGSPVGPAFDVVGGDVTEDFGAEVRHHARLDIVDPTGDLTPTDVDDLLMPSGRRLRISRGITESDEPPVPLATIFITGSRASLDADGRATIPVVGYDRTVRLQRPSHRPVTIPAARPIVDAIQTVLTVADPTVDFDVSMTTGAISPRLTFESDTDLWSEAAGMAATAGAELFVSRVDRVTVRPVPTTTRWGGDTVWAVTEAVDPPAMSSAVLTAETAIEADRLPNGVVVVGQHSSMSAPVRGEAWDLNPTSPTYRWGRYGAYPRFVRTEKATTVAAATAMARAILQTIGAATEVDVDVWPPPVHLVAGDPIRLDLPSVGARGNYLLARIVTPLASPDAPAQCTFRRSLLDDGET